MTMTLSLTASKSDGLVSWTACGVARAGATTGWHDISSSSGRFFAVGGTALASPSFRKDSWRLQWLTGAPWIPVQRGRWPWSSRQCDTSWSEPPPLDDIASPPCPPNQCPTARMKAVRAWEMEVATHVEKRIGSDPATAPTMAAKNLLVKRVSRRFVRLVFLYWNTNHKMWALKLYWCSFW